MCEMHALSLTRYLKVIYLDRSQMIDVSDCSNLADVASKQSIANLVRGIDLKKLGFFTSGTSIAFMPRDTKLTSLLPHIRTVMLLAWQKVFFRFEGSVEEVQLSNKNHLKGFIHEVNLLFSLNQFDLERINLFAGDDLLPVSSVIFEVFEGSCCGYSIEKPIDVRVFRSLYLRFQGSVRSVPTINCDYFDQLIPAVIHCFRLPNTLVKRFQFYFGDFAVKVESRLPHTINLSDYGFSETGVEHVGLPGYCLGPTGCYHGRSDV